MNGTGNKTSVLVLRLFKNDDEEEPSFRKSDKLKQSDLKFRIVFEMVDITKLKAECYKIATALKSRLYQRQSINNCEPRTELKNDN